MSKGIIYPEVHLTNNSKARRKSTLARGFMLSEQWLEGEKKPKKMLAGNATDLVGWLDVEGSPRYQRLESGITYCNIYAYDYCYQAGVYLPHVWWTEQAIRDMDNGETVEKCYPYNIVELNANATFDWLVKYSYLYGWYKCSEENVVQELVNEGNVGVVCAKGRIGHITIILPEGYTTYQEDTGYLRKINCEKDKTRKKMLLQSQAGWENKEVFSDRWYEEFKQFGFWVNLKGRE